MSSIKEKNVLLTGDGSGIDLLIVRAFDLIAGKLFGVYRTMDTFTGRKQA